MLLLARHGNIVPRPAVKGSITIRVLARRSRRFHTFPLEQVGCELHDIHSTDTLRLSRIYDVDTPRQDKP